MADARCCSWRRTTRRPPRHFCGATRGGPKNQATTAAAARTEAHRTPRPCRRRGGVVAVVERSVRLAFGGAVSCFLFALRLALRLVFGGVMCTCAQTGGEWRTPWRALRGAFGKAHTRHRGHQMTLDDAQKRRRDERGKQLVIASEGAKPDLFNPKGGGHQTAAPLAMCPRRGQHTATEVDPGATTALSWGMSTSGNAGTRQAEQQLPEKRPGVGP